MVERDASARSCGGVGMNPSDNTYAAIGDRMRRRVEHAESRPDSIEAVAIADTVPGVAVSLKRDHSAFRRDRFFEACALDALGIVIRRKTR